MQYANVWAAKFRIETKYADLSDNAYALATYADVSPFTILQTKSMFSSEILLANYKCEHTADDIMTYKLIQIRQNIFIVI